MRSSVQSSPFGIALAHLAAFPRRLRLLARDRRLERLERAAARPRTRDRLDEVRRFYVGYEEAVEVLVAAVNLGVSPALQARYESLRPALLADYGRIKPYLLAYLRMTVADAEYGLHHFDRPSDAFEVLFGHEDLSVFVGGDDGEMIRRIVRTREALTLYTDHLRFLSRKGSF